MSTPVIVVGVDGSPESHAALRWALNEAPRRNARVEAVLAHRAEPAFVPASPMGFNPHGDMPPQHPEQELHAAVQQVRALVPGAAEVAETVVVGDAARQLARASQDAELLVVGTRGRGKVAGAVLGSVAAECLRHAQCPVVVIPRRAVH